MIDWLPYADRMYKVRFDRPRVVVLSTQHLLFIFKLKDIKMQNEYVFARYKFTELTNDSPSEILAKKSIAFVVPVPSEFSGTTLKADFASMSFPSCAFNT